MLKKTNWKVGRYWRNELKEIDMKKCIKYQAPFEETTNNGRNKSYCSVACRRSAELEIRRINDRIAGLEIVAESYRMNIPVLDLYGSEESVNTELNRQEIRLRELLSGMTD